jgi:hypothetical protein
LDSLRSLILASPFGGGSRGRIKLILILHCETLALHHIIHNYSVTYCLTNHYRVMAKQIGSQIIARIDDYSLYHDRLHGYLVRRTGGVTSKQYKTDPKYAAARDASSEFTNVSKAGKLIRQALSPFIQQVKDGSMVNRMNKELVALKQADNKHERGERRPETMLADTNANKWFRIFQFNEGVKIVDLIESFPIISKKQHGLNVNTVKLLPAAFPVGATHAGLTLVQTVIDFEKGCFQTSASQICIQCRDAMPRVREMPRVQNGLLHTPKAAIQCIPQLEGTEIICLQVLFFKEQNGTLVQLKGNIHSMGIIEISAYQPVSKIRKGRSLRFRKKTRLRPDIRFIPQKFPLLARGSGSCHSNILRKCSMKKSALRNFSVANLTAASVEAVFYPSRHNLSFPLRRRIKGDKTDFNLHFGTLAIRPNNSNTELVEVRNYFPVCSTFFAPSNTVSFIDSI